MNYADVVRLSERFGDSFYLCDLARFRRNYDEFLHAFRAIYPRTQLAYSYKTNYTPAICRVVDERGGCAEVVSGMEYELAVRLGVAPERIIFNGPYKARPDFERALLAGSVVNLDSHAELDWLSEIAAKYHGQILRVGIRCAYDAGGDDASRFGIDADNGELEQVVGRVRKIGNARFEGLHRHRFPLARSAEGYRRAAVRMLELVHSIFRDEPPRWIDLGGGFFSRMDPSMARQFASHIPDFREYAEAIAGAVKEAYPGADGPELILEPGMALVADVFQFATQVADVKTIKGRKFAVVTGSVYNIRPNKTTRNFPIQRLAGGESGLVGKMDIVGYTCMEDDILHRGYEGELAVGDWLLFDNVGAYSLVLKPPFILPSPPVITVGDGQTIKRRETFDDVFATFKMD